MRLLFSICPSAIDQGMQKTEPSGVYVAAREFGFYDMSDGTFDSPAYIAPKRLTVGWLIGRFGVLQNELGCLGFDRDIDTVCR